MRKFTKDEFKRLQGLVGVVAGIYKMLEDDRFKDVVPVRILRRFNSRLDEIKNITHDNEFINFSVRIMTAWSDDEMVDNSEFKFRINEFFGYLNHTYRIKIEEGLFQLIISRLKTIFLSNLKKIIIGVIITVIGGVILARIL